MSIKNSISRTALFLKGLLNISQPNLDELPFDFDAESYLKINQDLKPDSVNPFRHYLTFGKAEGRQYRLDVSSEHGQETQVLPSNFSEKEYLRLNEDLADYTGNLTEHYLKYGIFELRPYHEAHPPSIPKSKKFDKLPHDFDPAVYLALNEDLLHAAIDPYEHYQMSGFSEGRPVNYPDLTACYGRPFDEHLPTILLASHEASRTGAPVLAWNICKQLQKSHNVVVLLLGDGSLVQNFQQTAHATYLIPTARHNTGIAKTIAKELHRRHSFASAIVNSMESGILCRALTLAGVSSTLLVHEFAAYTTPKQRFLDAYIWASETVFSNNLIKDNAIHCFPDNLFENTHVIPQGQCVLPTSQFSSEVETSKTSPSENVGAFIKRKDRHLVIGLGTICFRKGVDLFIETANRMVALAGSNAFDFVWIGGFPPYSHEYAAFLTDQIERSGLQDVVRIEAETDDLDAIYAQASLLLMTSRLDPLPNIAIDAICAGLPMVCFEKASGIAELLNEHGLYDPCIAQYINTTDMAEKAVQLISLPNKDPIKSALREIGEEVFSMPRYIERLMTVSAQALGKFHKHAHDISSLLQTKQFDLIYYLGDAVHNFVEEVETEYCTEYFLTTLFGATHRKPSPGFNPLIYQESLSLPRDIEPFSHYISHAENSAYHAPAIITPGEPLLEGLESSPRIALQIHVHYPEMLDDILQRLPPNRTKFDLFVSTDSLQKRTLIEKSLDEFGLVQAQISIHPNMGRDVYPLLATCKTIIRHYDIIGHVHTKKSPHALHVPNLVPRWRNLLLGNLLGSPNENRMLDRIVNFMTSNPEIQIVFPDDPFIEGWGNNVSIAQQLISESQFASLPTHFDFPIGTMFWARSSYLQQFVDMDLPERFTPHEPLAIDSTALHACERLFGALASSKKPQYALTFVPGLVR